jgi:replicative DNA helicase
MLTLLERRDPIDLQTVTDVLHRRGQLERIGGGVYLAELTESVVTTANVAHHARLIREKALLRSVINISTSLSAMAYEQAELPDILSRAHESLQQVASAQSTSSFATIQSLMRHAIHTAGQRDDRAVTGIPTGFHDLDALTSGWQPSDLIILAARPSQGKSALALQFAMTAATHAERLPVVVFSLEMSKEQVGTRILCSEARLNAQQMRRSHSGSPDFGRLMNTAERLHDVDLLVDDTSSLTILDIRARTRRLQTERGLGMIVIDYLQLLTSHKKHQNRQQEISEISRDLKVLAKELNVPVIALSQLNRDVETRDPPIPVLSDLRDSGSIEQDADLVMFIYRGDLHTQSGQHRNSGDPVARLILSKQRNGPTGEVQLVFQSAYARFDALAHEHHHQTMWEAR